MAWNLRHHGSNFTMMQWSCAIKWKVACHIRHIVLMEKSANTVLIRISWSVSVQVTITGTPEMVGGSTSLIQGWLCGRHTSRTAGMKSLGALKDYCRLGRHTSRTAGMESLGALKDYCRLRLRVSHV